MASLLGVCSQSGIFARQNSTRFMQRGSLDFVDALLCPKKKDTFFRKLMVEVPSFKVSDTFCFLFGVILEKKTGHVFQPKQPSRHHHSDFSWPPQAKRSKRSTATRRSEAWQTDAKVMSNQVQLVGGFSPPI